MSLGNKNESSLENLEEKLEDLRDDQHYISILDDIKPILGILAEKDNVYVEAALIIAVKRTYEECLEAEVVLMSFGLLKGYCRNEDYFQGEENSKKLDITERRIKFLKESNYLQELYKGPYRSYEEAEKDEGGVKKITDAIRSAEKRYIKKVANKLYANSRDILNTIFENEDNFIIKEHINNNKKIKMIPILPSMREKRDNSSSQSQSEEPNDSVKPDGSGRRKTEPGHTNTWWGNFSNNKILKIIQRISIKIILFNISETNQHVTIGGNFTKREINYKRIISGAVIVIAITALAYGGYKAVYKSSHRQPIKEILISSTEIILEPDEIFDLDEYISVLPKSITNPILSFTSSDPDLVTVSKDGLLSAKNVQQDDELHAAEITVQAENGTTAKKIVHVQDSDKKTSIDTDYEINQEVRIAGDTDKTWKKEVNAKVGDKVEFQLEYLNTDPNGLSQRDVVVGNTLPASLKYVAGSTKIWNESYNGASIDQDTITTTGVNIGHYAAGANAFVRFTAEVVAENLAKGSNVLVTWGRTTVENYVLQDSAKVRVRNDVNEDTEIFYTIENDVRIVNSIDKTWKKEVNAKIGDKVEFQIEYKNTSGESQKNVMLRDILPANLKYVPDSTRLANGNHPNGATIDQDDLVTTKGINIGSYAPGANALVRFYAEVVDENLADGEFVLHNWAHGTVNAKVLQDSARVRVEK